MSFFDGALAQLEQRIAALEARGGGANEPLSQNLTTVNPDGTTGANFTGHVAARGIDLPAATAAQTISEVRWVRAADGSVAAYISEYESGATGEVLAVAVNPSTTATDATVSLQANSAGGSDSNAASLQVHRSKASDSNADLNTDVYAYATNAAGVTQGRTIIDGKGQSNFLQLVANAARTVNFGVANITFSGGNTSAIVTVQHGLARVPVAVLLSVTGGQYGIIPFSTNLTTSGFDLSGSVSGTATGTFPIAWLAIG